MATKRKGIRKNRKIKFSEKNYIEKTYMRRGKAVIPVKLEKISDLYMEHDYKQVELADSVCNYIEEIAYMIPIHKDIILEIHCPKVDEEEQSKIKKSIKIPDCPICKMTETCVKFWLFGILPKKRFCCKMCSS